MGQTFAFIGICLPLQEEGPVTDLATFYDKVLAEIPSKFDSKIFYYDRRHYPIAGLPTVYNDEEGNIGIRAAYGEYNNCVMSSTVVDKDKPYDHFYIDVVSVLKTLYSELSILQYTQKTHLNKVKIHQITTVARLITDRIHKNHPGYKLEISYNPDESINVAVTKVV